MSAALRPMAGRLPNTRQAAPHPAVELEALAHAVRCLSPSHRDPEAFHVNKSEIVAELRRLARALSRAA